MEMTGLWDIASCSLIKTDRCFRDVYYLHHQGDEHALMMEAVSISKTLVNFYQTTGHNISEDSHLHIRRSENLKYHILVYMVFLRP
jgi:hypothetical protein